MAEIIKQSWVEHIDEYRLVFDTNPKRGTGYSFPCDKDGAVYVNELSDVAFKNYNMCIDSGIKPHISDYSCNYHHPAVIACDECGGEVQLTGFTNTCYTCEERGIITDYNMSGQRLAPRSQWGEETGETAGDILMGGDDYDY